MHKRRVRTDLRQHFFTESVTQQHLEFFGRGVRFCRHSLSERNLQKM